MWHSRRCFRPRRNRAGSPPRGGAQPSEQRRLACSEKKNSHAEYITISICVDMFELILIHQFNPEDCRASREDLRALKEERITVSMCIV